MAVPTKGIMKILSVLARAERLKVIITHGTRSSVIAGFMAAMGSLMFGFVGAVLGGALGGYIAAVTSVEFQSVDEILKSMESSQKEDLAERVRAIMKYVGVSNLAVFEDLVTSGAALRNQVLIELTGYLKDEMKMEVTES